MSQSYNAHMFICQHCAVDAFKDETDPRANASKFLAIANKKVQEKFGEENAAITPSECLNNCGSGVSCVLYPQGTWEKLDLESELEILEVFENSLK